MNIFVINSGSSSLKYQLFKMPVQTPVCTGTIERIGSEGSLLNHKTLVGNKEFVIKDNLDLPDHQTALKKIVDLLTNEETGVIQNPDEIEAVGHRVVHGGELFAATTIINLEVKEEIKKLFPLAPLHNPANYMGIEVAEKIFPSAKQIAVFDTAFHQTMPEKAYRYAIPGSFYSEFRIRVYGFHGTSHKYVSAKAVKYLNNCAAKIITVHLGNGCSMAAVDAGKSIDTSMGFGPLGGLIMGTRSGDIDPSVIFHLIDELGYNVEDVRSLLNRQSGMLGLTGKSDMRDISAAIDAGDANSKLAVEMYAYRIKKYIGSYATVLNGLDAIVFTAGVGENAANVRASVCENMNFFAVAIDPAKNAVRSSEIREINTPDSKVKILVIPTNEELEIAQQCYQLLKSG